MKMKEIKIFENGNHVTTLFVKEDEAQNAESAIKTLMTYASRRLSPNFQYTIE